MIAEKKIDALPAPKLFKTITETIEKAAATNAGFESSAVDTR